MMIATEEIQEQTDNTSATNSLPENLAPPDSSQEQCVFSLDIGTRSVIGIVGVMQEDKLQILGFNKVEHSKRAMIDGQIEDIEQVSRCIDLVKQNLENQLNMKFSTVAIAAAGRALQTQKIAIERKLNPGEIITEDVIRTIEMEAIEQAQAIVQQEERGEGKTFYCVGHTVVSYMLDGYEMSTILGHQGSSCVTTLLIAFLPKIVVESLYAAMDRSGLDVVSLTLEPIAAMNVVIPPDIRMLNLALVDIGAGTADIAISKSGAVIAYDMVTVAGDEITEAIMQTYLVDFNTAEQIKQRLDKQTTIDFTDILGLDQEVSRIEIMAAIAPAVEQLVTIVSQKICQMNGTAPTALFLVGGGSMYPGLSEAFANKLEMDSKRVAVGGKTHLQKLVTGYESIASPEFITPVGIALTSILQNDYNFAIVTVNGKKVRQFRYDGLKISDVLILSGDFKYDQLVGCIGKRLRFTYNGRQQVISGGVAKPAEIALNGQPASLESLVYPGDKITITTAINGENARRTIGQVVTDSYRLVISLDEVLYEVGRPISCNGLSATVDDDIHEGDVLSVLELETLDQLLAYHQLESQAWHFIADGATIDRHYRFQGGEQIHRQAEELSDAVEETVSKQFLPSEEKTRVVIEATTEATIDEPQEALQLFGGVKSLAAASFGITLNERKLVLPPKEDGGAYMLFDLFNYVDGDLLNRRDRVLMCTINGKERPFTTILQNGDVVGIK